MAGVEILAVVGCVAAVVSAYRDGSEIVRDLRRLRAQRKALQYAQTAAALEDREPEELETSLVHGCTSVQSQYDRNFRRLGRAYADGDQVAREQLKDIIIQLQIQVIASLRNAYQGDKVVDFQALQNTSDETQDQAVLCLLNLQKRLLVAAKIETIVPIPTRVQGFIEPESRTSTWSTQASATASPRISISSSTPQAGAFSVGSSPPHTQSTLTFRRKTIDPEERTNRGRVSRLAGILRRNRHSEGDGPMLPQTYMFDSHLPSGQALDSRRDSAVETLSSGGSSALISPTEDPIGFNPWTDHRPSQPPTTSPLRSPRQSIPHSLDSSSNLATTSGITPNRNLPAEHNKYRGLCKSAWRMQTCQRQAIEERARPASAFGIMRYWSCTKCAFEGKMVDAGGFKTLDRTIRDAATTAGAANWPPGVEVRYRWRFLFNSHVPTKNNATPSFGCMFCCAEDRGMPVFAGVENFLQHVGMDHVGEGKWVKGEEVLARMNCVPGRRAGLSEDWDVNLVLARD